MDATKFEWINSSNDDDQKYDSGKRRIIRVQAMRAAAASRKNSVMWGKHNMRQPEVVRYASSRSTDSSDASTDDHDNTEVPGSHAIVQRSSVRARSTCKPSKGHVIPIIRYLITDGNPTTTRLGASAFTQFEQWNGRPQRPMLLPGFEDLSAEIGVNVLDLDELTGVATGQVACSMLHQERTSLDKLIVRRRQSYLFHIPARYGVSSCLDDALRCIVTKAKRVLVGGVINPALDLQLYGRALRSLQNAVDKSGDWRDPNILGAIEILSIYEVSPRLVLMSSLVSHHV